MKKPFAALILGVFAASFSFVEDARAGGCCLVDPSGLYIGMGVMRGSVTSDTLINGTESVSGLYFGLGYRIVEQLSAEMVFDIALDGSMPVKPVTDLGFPEDRADFSVIYMGVKADLFPLSERGWTPWLGLGVAMPTFAWHTRYYNQDYFHEGFSPYIAAGIDKHLGGGWLLSGRFSAVDSKDSEDTWQYPRPGMSYSGGSISVVYEFGRE